MTNTRDKLAMELSIAREAISDATFKAGWDACEKEYKPKLDLALAALKIVHKDMKMTVSIEGTSFDILAEAIQMIERKK